MQPEFAENNLEELKKRLDKVGGLITPEQWKAVHGKPEPAAAQGFAPFVPFEKSASETLPEFPVEALPPVLRNLCKEAAPFLQVTPGLIAPSLLATCALCLQGAFQIEGKPGHTEALSLYCATVERSSGNKTQAFELAVSPVREWQRVTNKNLRQRVNAWNTHLKKLQAKLKNAETEMEQSGDEKEVNAIKAELDEHAEAEERELFLLQGDCTPESLFDAIVDNRGCAGLFAGEPDLMTTATGGRYSKEENLSTLLDAYSGKGEITKSRVTTGRKSVEKPHLTVNFMAQPNAIAKFLGNESFVGRGLVARFLISFPKSLVGKGRVYDTPPISDYTQSMYSNLIFGLLDTWEAITREKDYTPVTLHLTPEAFKALCDLYGDTDSRVNDDLYCIESFAGKYHGTVLRLAGILHCVKKNVMNENAPPVSLETWREAEQIGAYFTEHMKHAVSLSGKSESPAEADARYIWERIRKSEQTQISKSNLMRLCQRFKKAKDMNAGINALVEHGYIRVVISGEGRGRKSEMIETNPEAS